MLNSLSKLKYFYIFLKNNYCGNILKFSLLNLQIFSILLTIFTVYLRI